MEAVGGRIKRGVEPGSGGKVKLGDAGHASPV